MGCVKVVAVMNDAAKSMGLLVTLSWAELISCRYIFCSNWLGYFIAPLTLISTTLSICLKYTTFYSHDHASWCLSPVRNNCQSGC